jgi:hypothetical protein
MAKRAREMSIGEWLGEQEWLPSALARLVDQRRPKALASIRRVTAETEFQDAVAKIVAEYPTGGDPASDRYQAHSLIKQQKIYELFLRRWDATDLALGRAARKDRRNGGIATGAINREDASDRHRSMREIWQREHGSVSARKLARQIADGKHGRGITDLSIERIRALFTEWKREGCRVGCKLSS